MQKTIIILGAFSILGVVAVACSIDDRGDDLVSTTVSRSPDETRIKKAPPVQPEPVAEIERERVMALEVEADLSQGLIRPQSLIDMAGNSVTNALTASDSRLVMPRLPTVVENRDHYEDVEPNPVKLVSEEPVSTFSVDVDTASYANVRRYLEDGVLPPLDAVRIEEMVNYFDYDYAAPLDPRQPFATDIALFTSPWDGGRQLLRIGIKGYEIDAAERPPANLVFLIDTSGSMASDDKLPLLQRSLKLLVDEMRDEDRISIVAYAGSAGVVLEPTAGADRAKIIRAIEDFQAGGGTAGSDGIRQAYRMAEAEFDDAAINRVVLATDGDFNVGISDPDRLEDFIATKRETGVYLSILGFGRGNLNDHLMQKLAQAGNGNASYIDGLMEARKVLVDEIGSTLFPIADDVKVQIEFNPERVAEYRLIGYETRMLAREDFNNDRIDAGEIGSGHTVTALYEITPTDSSSRLVDDLRYGIENTALETSGAARSDEVAWLRLRFKRPGEDISELIEQPVLGADATSFEQAGQEAKFAAAVVAFGQILKRSPHLGSLDFDAVAEMARTVRGDDPFGYRSDFLQLVRLAKSASVLEAGSG